MTAEHQRLNYCTQAIETLTGFDLGVAQENREPTFALARDTKALLTRAEKFIMPEWGRVFTDEEWQLVQDVEFPARLPYPIIALEYPSPYDAIGDSKLLPHEARASRRICLAAEYEAVVALAPEVLGPTAERMPPDVADEEERLGFYIWPVSYVDALGLWTPPPVGLFVPRDGSHGLMSGGGHIVLTPLGMDAYSFYSTAERPKRASRDVADEATVLTHMQVALALDKGRHETIPAPEKLNKKRAKRGRPPLFEYKVLDLIADVMNASKEVSHGRQGRSHSSPRMHTRRGHVRKLASGKTTWVRNTLVGRPGRGQVIKDYQVRHEDTR